MNTICGNCGLSDARLGHTNCDGCQRAVHFKCVGLSEHDTKLTRAKSKAVKVVCNACNDNMSQFKDLKNVLQSIQNSLCTQMEQFKQEFSNEINKLRNEFSNQIAEIRSSGAVSAPTAPTSQEDIIQEVVERQKRKKNVIVVGVPESSDIIDNDARRIKDLETVKTIISTLQPNLLMENLKLFRLGKFETTNSRNRPIKVLLNSEDDAEKLIRSSKKLSGTETFKNCAIYSDKTPKQWEYYKQLKDQLNQRIQSGETNLVIRYFNDVPKIITLKKSLN